MAIVAEFLRAGTSLLQAVVGNGVGSTDLSSWIEQFQHFAIELTHEATVSTAVGAADVVGVEKACWKLSQDILIRMRRLMTARTMPSSESNGLDEDLRSVFTEQDIESLRTQLFSIQMRWQSLQPEAETPL